MPNRKIAISIEEPLYQQGERLAQEMRVSRSRLYALALEAFIQRRESQAMLEQLDRVYGEGPPPEERPVLQAARNRQLDLVKGEW